MVQIFIWGMSFVALSQIPETAVFRQATVWFLAKLYCGECDMCRSGQEQLCRKVDGTNDIGFVCNGTYADKYVGKASNAYKLPDTVSDVATGLIDPLMVAHHAIHQGNVKLHDKVLVVGSGIIGQLIGGLAKRAGASYVAMSKVNDRKITKAKEIGDFNEYFDGNDPKRSKNMKVATDGGFDVAFEVVGAGETLQTCMDGIRPGGKIVMIGNLIDPEVYFSMNRAGTGRTRRIQV